VRFLRDDRTRFLKAEQPEGAQSPNELVLQLVLVPYNRDKYPFRMIKKQEYALLNSFLFAIIYLRVPLLNRAV
jgi:hypothetical protein